MKADTFDFKCLPICPATTILPLLPSHALNRKSQKIVLVLKFVNMKYNLNEISHI